MIDITTDKAICFDLGNKLITVFSEKGGGHE